MLVLSVFADLHDKKANGIMTFVVKYMNQNSRYRGKFEQGKRNLAQVSGEVRIIRVRVTGGSTVISIEKIYQIVFDHSSSATRHIFNPLLGVWKSGQTRYHLTLKYLL